MNSPALRPRPGFAMLMAIGLLAFVGAALLAITTLVSTDARRTSAVRQDAQLRQLLLAGTAAVQERSRSWGESLARQEFDLPLPPAQSEEPAKVHIIVTQHGQTVIAEITARGVGRQARQQAQFHRKNGTWQLTAAAFDAGS